jgi:hypothetical protein
MPFPGHSQIPLSARIAELNHLATEAGRGRIPVSIFGASPRPEAVQHYAELGVERCIFWLPSASREEVLPLLDDYAELARNLA